MSRLTDAAASVVGLTRNDVSATAIVPDRTAEGRGVMVTLGGGAQINVRITLDGGNHPGHSDVHGPRERTDLRGYATD